MLLIFLQSLDQFAQRHANSRKHIAAWKTIVEKASWRKKQDVLKDFPKAKMIASNRARFEIAHNTYRLIAEIDYEDQLVTIRFIGTHSEYDKIDPETI